MERSSSIIYWTVTLTVVVCVTAGDVLVAVTVTL